MSDPDVSGGPLDVPTLEVIGQRAVTHPLVERRAFRPDSLSPRRLELALDADGFPEPAEAARLDVRWFEGGDYTVHYLEFRGRDTWQRRWDRHPKTGAPKRHFHPSPDAASVVEPSEIDATHPLGVLFFVLDRVGDRIQALHRG